MKKQSIATVLSLHADNTCGFFELTFGILNVKPYDAGSTICLTGCNFEFLLVRLELNVVTNFR